MKFFLVLAAFIGAAAAAAADLRLDGPLSFIRPRNPIVPVHVGVYYESMCPDCQDFIAGELKKAWEALEKSRELISLMQLDSRSTLPQL